MTAFDLLIVFALTWLSVQIINLLLPPPDQKRQPLLTLILLIVYFVWVVGVQIIVARRGG